MHVCVVWLTRCRMNAALKRFDGLFIIPVLQLCWTCLAIVGGGIFFQEFLLFTASQWVGFMVGVAFVLAGVWVLMSSREQQGTHHPSRLALGLDGSSSSSLPWRLNPHAYHRQDAGARR